MQGACLVEIHRPGNIIQIIIICWIVVAHGLGFFFLVDLEQPGTRPEGFETGGDDGGKYQLVIFIDSQRLFCQIDIDPATVGHAFGWGGVWRDGGQDARFHPFARTDHVPFHAICSLRVIDLDDVDIWVKNPLRERGVVARRRVNRDLSV